MEKVSVAFKNNVVMKVSKNSLRYFNNNLFLYWSNNENVGLKSLFFTDLKKIPKYDDSIDPLTRCEEGFYMCVNVSHRKKKVNKNKIQNVEAKKSGEKKAEEKKRINVDLIEKNMKTVDGIVTDKQSTKLHKYKQEIQTLRSRVQELSTENALLYKFVKIPHKKQKKIKLHIVKQYAEENGQIIIDRENDIKVCLSEFNDVADSYKSHTERQLVNNLLTLLWTDTELDELCLQKDVVRSLFKPKYDFMKGISA